MSDQSRIRRLVENGQMQVFRSWGHFKNRSGWVIALAVLGLILYFMTAEVVLGV